MDRNLIIEIHLFYFLLFIALVMWPVSFVEKLNVQEFLNYTSHIAQLPDVCSNEVLAEPIKLLVIT